MIRTTNIALYIMIKPVNLESPKRPFFSPPAEDLVFVLDCTFRLTPEDLFLTPDNAEPEEALFLTGFTVFADEAPAFCDPEGADVLLVLEGAAEAREDADEVLAGADALLVLEGADEVPEEDDPACVVLVLLISSSGSTCITLDEAALEEDEFLAEYCVSL